MHTLKLRLDIGAKESRILTKRMKILAHIHNVGVAHVLKLLRRLKYDKEYQALLKEYRKDFKGKKKLSKEKRKRKNYICARMAEIRENLGLTHYALEAWLAVCRNKYKEHISSEQGQKEALYIWRGVEKVLFGNGKTVHFKKARDFDTIGAKSNKNGARFDKETMTVAFLGLVMPVKLPKKDSDLDYVYESLSSDISYCEIHRKMFNNGWHYYACLVLKGDAPKKKRTAGYADAGLDPGVSSVAYVSDDKVILEELGPGLKKHDDQIREIQAKMERLKRLQNPDRYEEDGSYKKGSTGKWHFSKHYFKLRDRLKTLYRKKHAALVQSHNILANRIVADAKSVRVEANSWKAMAKRKKKSGRQDTSSEIKNKDGTTKRVFKYKKRKRFGSSIGARAPGLFLNTLKQRCNQQGVEYIEVSAYEAKASQYDHVSDIYKKISLKERDKLVGGHKVQRDLYSAFLLKNTDSQGKVIRTQCNEQFESFLVMQGNEIRRMKAAGISMKQVFGF